MEDLTRFLNTELSFIPQIKIQEYIKRCHNISIDMQKFLFETLKEYKAYNIDFKKRIDSYNKMKNTYIPLMTSTCDEKILDNIVTVEENKDIINKIPRDIYNASDNKSILFMDDKIIMSLGEPHYTYSITLNEENNEEYNECNIKYIYYYLSFIKDLIHNSLIDNKEINQYIFLNYQIPFPSINIQNNIVTEYDIYDKGIQMCDKKDMNNEIISALEAILR